MEIINYKYEWDNSYIGSFKKEDILETWNECGEKYIKLNNDKGIICGIIKKNKDNFCCIIEDIRELFGIKRRGINRIKIDNINYYLFYVNINENKQIIIETNIYKLKKDDKLRKDKKFIEKIRKIITIDYILNLKNCKERNIKIRKIGEEYEPIAYNMEETIIDKNQDIIPKMMYDKWFGEEKTIKDVIKDIIKGNKKKNIILTDLRNKIEQIINKYNKEYIWYSCFIIERIMI